MNGFNEVKWVWFSYNIQKGEKNNMTRKVYVRAICCYIQTCLLICLCMINAEASTNLFNYCKDESSGTSPLLVLWMFSLFAFVYCCFVLSRIGIAWVWNIKETHLLITFFHSLHFVHSAYYKHFNRDIHVRNEHNDDSQFFFIGAEFVSSYLFL